MNEQLIVAVLAAAGGWVLRHMGVGAPKTSAIAVRPAIGTTTQPAGLAGGLKGEIERIVKDAVEAAMAQAVAEIRAGVAPPHPVPPA